MLALAARLGLLAALAAAPPDEFDLELLEALGGEEAEALIDGETQVPSQTESDTKTRCHESPENLSACTTTDQP